MEKPNFTPGPWQVLPEEAHRPYLRIRGTRLGARYKIANVLLISGIDEWTQTDSDEARANARLIAAATDLYEACKAVLSEHRYGYGLKCLEQLEAAIKKAECS